MRSYEFRCRLERGQLHFAHRKTPQREARDLSHVCRLFCHICSFFSSRASNDRSRIIVIYRRSTDGTSALDNHYWLTNARPAHIDRQIGPSKKKKLLRIKAVEEMNRKEYLGKLRLR